MNIIILAVSQCLCSFNQVKSKFTLPNIKEVSYYILFTKVFLIVFANLQQILKYQVLAQESFNMSQIYDASLSEEDGFGVILSNAEYHKLINESKLYADSKKINQVLSQENESLKKQKTNLNLKLRQVRRDAFLIGQKLMTLLQENEIMTERMEELKTQMKKILKQNNELKQKVIEQIELMRESYIAKDQFQNQLKFLNNQLNEYKQRFAKNEQLIIESRTKTTVLQQQLQDQLQAKKSIINDYELKQKEHKSLLIKIAQTSLQIQRIASRFQFEQLESQNKQINQREKIGCIRNQSERISNLQKVHDHEKPSNIIQLLNYNHNYNQQQFAFNHQQSQSQLKHQVEQSYNSTDPSSSCLQLKKLKQSLSILSKALEFQQTLKREIQKLKEQNRSLEQSNNTLSKRFEIIQNSSKSKNEKLDKLQNQSNLAIIILKKFESMKSTFQSKQEIFRELEEFITKIREQIDNQYANIMQKLYDE